MRTHPRRYTTVAWGEIAPSDLEPKGDPEWAIEYRHELHIGLHIVGEYVPELGMLGIRCEVRNGEEQPISMAIADGSVAVSIEPAQSNPRRREDAEWR